MISREHFDFNVPSKLYCSEPSLIENYDKAMSDDSQIYVCHHRLETHFSDGTPRPKNAQLKAAELEALNVYYNRPPEELIFMTDADHTSLHQTGKYVSSATRRKLSEYNKMHPVRSFLGRHHSEETKNKIRETKKGKTPWNKGISLVKNVGKHWFNNGIEEVFLFDCPDGYVPGRLKRRKSF